MNDDIIFEFDEKRRRNTTVMEFLENHRAVAIQLLYGEWTTTPPTVEGWYWAQMGKGIPHIVKVDLFGLGVTGALWAYPTNDTKAHDLSDYDRWLGPLPPPEAPKD